MTRFLKSSTRKALLDDLSKAGFTWTDENGEPRIPAPFEQTTNPQGDACIYLGHVPIQTGTDAEGNPIMGESSDWCANVTACEGLTFATEIPAPSKPYNVFA